MYTIYRKDLLCANVQYIQERNISVLLEAQTGHVLQTQKKLY